MSMRTEAKRQARAEESVRAAEVSRLFDDHIIVFTHIPKCGGRSVWMHLRKIFGREHFLRVRIGAPPIGDTMSAEQKRAVHVFNGHFGFRNKYVQDFHRTPLYIATVRDPIDRLISYHSYFVEKSDREEVKNPHARMTLDEAMQDIINGGHNSALAGPDQCDWLSGSRTCEEAIRNVEESYLLVLPMHSLTAMAELFARVSIGSTRPTPVLHENKTKIKPTLSLALREKLAELTTEDRRLYEHVVANEQRYLARAEDRLRGLVAGAG